MTNSVKKLIVSNRRYSENQVHTSLKRPAIKLLGGGGGGGGVALTSLRSTNPRPLFCLGFSDT